MVANLSSFYHWLLRLQTPGKLILVIPLLAWEIRPSSHYSVMDLIGEHDGLDMHLQTCNNGDHIDSLDFKLATAHNILLNHTVRVNKSYVEYLRPLSQPLC
ncbi:hypothetical protein M758_12G181400 [Ceratodon purpureus]|uniref:Uncharacterized protein n=1 Tax=Ceratodon purpureus TaxID=3225 RepID=A0A8T0GCJ7_CERPU|nr:hypothetical protein KC19_12G177700 [Ceratodon purpureus]KAG0599827.1 hypothetical protein M758_12G181400 [Ceratodon purpureus]